MTRSDEAIAEAEATTSCAAIAFGGNLGDTRTILEDALGMFDADPNIEVLQRSSWYVSKPVGPPQPDYINGCVVVRTHLPPRELLARLHEIEHAFGRERKEHWGARTLDLDLILYDQIVLDDAVITVPHPRMRERAFVLTPLAEIAPDWIDPLSGANIASLNKAVDPAGLKKLMET